VNWLDLVVIAALLLSGYAGLRLGLAARALSWIGLAVGVVVDVIFVDDVANLLQSASPRTRLLGAAIFVFLVAVIGQTLGLTLGSVVNRHLPFGGPVRSLDRVAGAVAGGFGVLIVLWLLIPALASAPGWPARAVRDSAIARAINDIGPEPPSSMAALGRLVGDAPFPEVFDRLTSPDAGPPPSNGLSPDVAARVTPDVVKLVGRACDQIQSGSGVVLSNDLVVTNAHVVAGQRVTQVSFQDGRTVDGSVVGFDPDRDLALVRADTAGLTPLRRADANVDSAGEVFGYPGGGPLSQQPARIAQRVVARGTNIYRTETTRRDVFVLAAELAPGDSGGPLVDQDGRVTGIAFAIDPSSDTTAFALTGSEVDAFLSEAQRIGTNQALDTGPCLIG